MAANVRKPLIETLKGVSCPVPPLWMMRQAGRYLPEYRALRAEAGSFLDLCYHPQRAAEVTLQPIRRFQFDAAIIFSDILVIPHALGLQLEFVAGDGPKLQKVSTAAGIAALPSKLASRCTEPVYEALRLVKGALPPETALIGFVGAPWTVATYMAAGKGSPDHAEARLWAYRDEAAFSALIDLLVDVSVKHLSGQIAAGADVVQIFDSWGGELPPDQFQRWCVEPLRLMVDALRRLHPDVPVIVFPRAAGGKIAAFAEGFEHVCIGLDTTEDRQALNSLLPSSQVVQGNLDPLALIAGGKALDRAVDAIRADFSNRPFVFNLGHGIKPETPVAHVEQLVKRVRDL